MPRPFIYDEIHLKEGFGCRNYSTIATNKMYVIKYQNRYVLGMTYDILAGWRKYDRWIYASRVSAERVAQNLNKKFNTTEYTAVEI